MKWKNAQEQSIYYYVVVTHHVQLVRATNMQWIVERGKRKKAQLKRAYVRIRVTKEGQLGMFAGIN